MWHDIQQNTDEWMELRSGRIGGSSIGKVMANYGKAFGDPAHSEALRIALTKINGYVPCQTYSNEHMERGHEQEPIARALYEDKYFCAVSNGGYFEHDEYTGVSPDGLVYDQGIIEIKSTIASTYFATIKRGSYDPKYTWQLCLELMVSGRKWIDYVEYCSEFPQGKNLFVHRITVDDLYDNINMVKIRMSEFKKLVCSKIETINNI